MAGTGGGGGFNESFEDVGVGGNRREREGWGTATNNRIKRGATVSSLEEWVKQTIELILSLCTTSQVLLIGAEETCLDSLLVACLRRLHSWSLVAIISELRLAIGPYKKFTDIEQFIELFNPHMINFTSRPPDFITTHQHLLAEEEKLLQRIQDRGGLLMTEQITPRCSIGSISEKGKEKGESNGEEEEHHHLSQEEWQHKQHEIDSILFNLFFPSNPHHTLTPGNAYDPSSSLINDDDDVD